MIIHLTLFLGIFVLLAGAVFLRHLYDVDAPKPHHIIMAALLWTTAFSVATIPIVELIAWLSRIAGGIFS